MATPSATDLAAFDVAIATLCREDPLQRRRIDDWLAGGIDYIKVAKVAAYRC